MPTLNSDEWECAKWLAARFDAGKPRFRFDEVPVAARLGNDATIATLDRFAHLGWVKWETDVGLLVYRQLVVELEPVLNPPPKDYWQAVTVWFKSKPWSLPVLLFLVVLPLLVQWVEMLGTLLRWGGVVK